MEGMLVKTLVRVVEFADDWPFVARDGAKMSYAPVEALAKMQ